MEEEMNFDEELSTLETILNFREPEFPFNFKALELRKLQDLLKEIQEVPMNIDSNLQVFIVSETKMNEFKSSFRNLNEKFFEIEKNYHKDFEEKLSLQEQIVVLKKQIQDINSQNEQLLKIKQPNLPLFQGNLSYQLGNQSNFMNQPKSSSMPSFFGGLFNTAPNFQIPPNNENKTPNFQVPPNTESIQELHINELNRKLESKENENKQLLEKFETLCKDFNRISQEKNEFSKFEKNEVYWRMKAQTENQRDLNNSLQKEINGLRSRLKLYEENELNNKNGLKLIKENILQTFMDLVDEGFETTSSSECENEIICRYFPETIKRLKLKLENESLKDKLHGISNDLNEQKSENKIKMEMFLKEVMQFEEIKENTLKKIDEYLVMIKQLTDEKIKRFNLNIEEFKVVDSNCLEMTEKLTQSYRLVEELTDKLGKNSENNRLLVEKYERDILINKSLIEDANRLIQEKNKMEKIIFQMNKSNKEEQEKNHKEIDTLIEKITRIEKINKNMMIENELLNMSCKKCNVDINFQLFQHFKQKFEDISLENQVLITKNHLNRDRVFELSSYLDKINEENSSLKLKLAEQNPENLLLTLLNIKEGSLKDILSENLENKDLIKDLNSNIQRLLQKIKDKESQINNLENHLKYVLNDDEIDVESNSEKIKMINPLNLIQLLEKSKVLLSMGETNQIS